MYYLRNVTIPDDALVYDEGNKFKANKIILGEPYRIKDLHHWELPVFCENAVNISKNK